MRDLEKLANIYYNAVMKRAQVLPLGQSSKSTFNEGMGDVEEVGGMRTRIQQGLGQKPQGSETPTAQKVRQQKQQLQAFLSQLKVSKPDYSQIRGWSQSFAIPVFQKVLNGSRPSATEFDWAQFDLRLRNYNQPGAASGWPIEIIQQGPTMLAMLKDYMNSSSSIVAQY
jgi:hypothetical protein